MLIRRSQSKKIKNSKDCTVWEYEYPSKLFSFATALINGRYPSKGRVMNQRCEEVYYVLSGHGTIHSEFGNFKINAKDLYFFKRAERYWVEGSKLAVILVNAPKWAPEQHKSVK